MTKKFLPELSRTSAGSVRIHIQPPRGSGLDNHRQRAAYIYELAAELERQSDELGARWVVSPEAFSSRIDLELAEGDDFEMATQFVAKVLADLGLADLGLA